MTMVNRLYLSLNAHYAAALKPLSQCDRNWLIILYKRAGIGFYIQFSCLPLLLSVCVFKLLFSITQGKCHCIFITEIRFRTRKHSL